MPDPSNSPRNARRRFFSLNDAGRPLFLDLLLLLGSLAFGAALILVAYLGTFSRYYADDYCLSGGLLSGGFWSSQVSLYTSWSPRFSGTFLLNLSEPWPGRWGRPAGRCACQSRPGWPCCCPRRRSSSPSPMRRRSTSRSTGASG